MFIVGAFGNEFAYPIIDKRGLSFVVHSSSSASSSTLAAMVDYASIPTVLTDFNDQMTFSMANEYGVMRKVKADT